MGIRFAAAAVLLVGICAAYPQQPNPPIIGIVTDPMSECTPPPDTVKATSCVESFYVRWLETAGMRVVTIPHNATERKLKWLAKRVNGVLFPGGGLGGSALAAYFQRAQWLFDWALEWNAQGDPFFLWGTCMGFQVISSCAARTLDVIKGPYSGMEPLMMPLNFTSSQASSRMFGTTTTPASILETLSTSNSTLNWHEDIISPAEWSAYPSMSSLVPLALDFVPGTSTPFVSALEGATANVFATQFHPERPPYEFSNDLIGHSPPIIAISQYLADFIRSRAAMNNHTFDTPLQAESHMIAQWPLVNHGWGHQTYYVIDQNDLE